MNARQQVVTHYAVRTVTFRRARWRGYSTADVDGFLDRVEYSLRAYAARLNAALAEVQRVKNWRWAHGIPERPALPTPAAVHLYSRAQQEAERLVANARRVAAELEQRQVNPQ